MSKNTIQFSYPVESINRKMTLRRNTASDQTMVHSNGTSVKVEKPVSRYMGSGERKIYRNGLGYISTNYLFVRFNKRGTAVSADELALRLTFSDASKLKKAWQHDMTSTSQAQAAFQAKESRKGVTSVGKSYSGWLFQVAYEVIVDGGTPASPFPQA